MLLVSVVIPTYQRRAMLQRAVESALGQTYQHIEVIVSDDHSTDGTLKYLQGVAARDKRLTFHSNLLSRGVGNWNHALSHARGQLIKMLFDDDWMEPTCLQRCVAALQTRPRCCLVAMPAWNHPADGRQASAGPDLPAGDMPAGAFLDLLRPGCNGHGGFLASVSPTSYLFRNLGLLFDWSFAPPGSKAQLWGSGCDVHYVMLHALLGGGVHILPEPLVHMSSHAGSTTVANLDAVLELTRAGAQAFLQQFSA